VNVKNPHEFIQPEERGVPGKWVIVFLIVLGVAGVAGSQLYYRYMQSRPIELWGQSEAKLMIDASQVSAVRFGESNKESAPVTIETLTIGGQRLRVAERKNVSHAPGLSHVRHSLINDASFEWGEPEGDCKPVWKYGLQFGNPQSHVMVLFDPDCRRAILAEHGKSVALNPRAMEGIATFLKEQFGEKEEKKEEGAKSPAK
jgi:hypothetical protein